MTHYIVPWSPLTQTGSIVLATVLFVITGILLYIGTRIHHPLATKRPGLFLGVCLVVIFLVSGIAFLVAEFVYALTLIKQLGGGTITEPANHITPITLACGVVAFFVIVYLTSSRGTSPISQRQFWVAVGSAIVGTIAAPLIFELPFDLIVMGRVYSPTPHVLFILLYFLPLILVEISSFAMLTFSPFLRVSRLTLFLLAGMFFIFAVWAVFSFTYASTPIPYACNAISKVLAFAVAVSLFLTRESADRSQAEPVGESLPRRESAGFV
ncbi:MAG: hypothetical protein ACLQUY_14685 [Ktedonobacterales bacterium]